MRVAAYVRVSTQDQVDGFSLPAQERAIREYVAAHGWEVVAWYRDEGLSARVDDTTRRPAFRQMLEDARARRFDTIITHKLDRFARNRRVAFNAFAELSEAKVGFISLHENLDYSSPAGQLMLTMLVGMSQFYSDNLAQETRKGKAERKQQGIYNGLLPFGVTKGPQGLPVADVQPWACNLLTHEELVPHTGLVLAFTLAADGRSDRDIARALTDRGFRTSGNRGQNPFTKDSVRVILRNRFYVGDLPDGDGWIPGKHEGVIDPALFDAAQAARQRNRGRQLSVVGERSPWCLSGMATCGLCGATLRVRGTAPNGGRYVGCSARDQLGHCTLPSVLEADLVEVVTSILAELTVPTSARERAIHAWRANRSSDIDANALRITLERKLGRLRELFLEGDIGRDEYHRRRNTMQVELDALPAITMTSDDDIALLWTSVEDAARRFPDASPLDQQAICRALFVAARINENRVVELTPRPEILAFTATCGSDGRRSHGWQKTSSGTFVRACRKRPSRRHLRDDQVAWVQGQDGRSLRDLAAILGVSREAIRTALKVKL